MATSSPLSFQGLSSGIQTDALIEAILAQEGRTLRTVKSRQEMNKARTSALTAMKSSLNSLSLSLASLKDKLNARTVTSTDANNAYVSATATAAQAGNYEVKVDTVATKARISSTSMAGADTAAAVFSGAQPATFALMGTDGQVKTFQLSNNSLAGLRDAINASGAGISATIINNGATGAGAKPYQLVLTANSTGTGTTNGEIVLADITSWGAGEGNLVGVGPGTIDDPQTPTTITGGLRATALGSAGTQASFMVNGIQMTRQSNVVSDVVDGVTFTLKQGGQTGTTTLTVAQDRTAATTGMQDVISKFNIIVKAYAEASATTKNADGSANPAALAGEPASRAVITQLKQVLTGASPGLPESAAYQRLSSIGIRTNSDGTLSLDTTAFQQALDKDPANVRKLFTFGGDSSNSAVSVRSGTSATTTGSVNFSIDTLDAQGNGTGTLNGVALTVTKGVANGTGSLAGLSLSVTGTGTGTLTLSRGAGQSIIDLISSVSATGSGTFASAIKDIQTQNKRLDLQLNEAQAMLDRRREVLKRQFSKMEVLVAQMRSTVGSLGSA